MGKLALEGNRSEMPTKSSTTTPGRRTASSASLRHLSEAVDSISSMLESQSSSGRVERWWNV